MERSERYWFQSAVAARVAGARSARLSREEYERMMQRPPDVEDALEFEEAVQEELGENMPIEREPPEGPG